MGDGHIAKKRDLVAHSLRDLILGPADDDIRPDSHPLQLPDAGLRRLGLELLRAVQIRHERHVDHAAGSLGLFLHELADGLVDGLGFDIAHRAAHLDDRDGGLVRPLGCLAVRGFLRPPGFHVEPALDLVGHMGNDLHRSAAVISAALLIQYGPVYFARGHVGVVIQALVDEALVVPQVQVCLRPVVGHENFAVLDRVHGARVHVEIGVELLHGHFAAARLQEPAQ